MLCRKLKLSCIMSRDGEISYYVILNMSGQKLHYQRETFEPELVLRITSSFLMVFNPQVNCLNKFIQTKTILMLTKNLIRYSIRFVVLALKDLNSLLLIMRYQNEIN